MRERFYIATFSQNAEEVIRQNRLGIELNDLCISESMDKEQAEKTLQAMRREIDVSCAESVLIHGPFTEIIPAAIDHRMVSLGMERLQEAYRFAEKLGVNRMVVHSGYIPLLYFQNWHLEKSRAFWCRFMEDKPADFHLYIENVFEDDPTIMKELVETVADPRIRLCLDVGHASAAAGPDCDVTEWIRILAPYIGHFHLHNNDGKSDRHDPLSDGILDMQEILHCITDCCGSDTTMTIESRVCDSSVQWLENEGFL